MLGAMSRKLRESVGVRLVEFVKEAPGDEQREHFGFSGAGRHLHHVARPVLVEHVAGHGAGGIETQQIELVAGAPHVIEPDDRLDRFALGEVVAE